MAADPQPRYADRYFNARTGEVALTCCHTCGDIVWNPKLHEETHHGKQQDSNQEQVSDVGQFVQPVEPNVETPSEKPGLSEAGVQLGGGADAGTGRPGGAGQRTSRATKAGSGK